MKRGKSDTLALARDARLKEIINALWRDRNALYGEKYSETWLHNFIAEAIEFGLFLGQDNLIESNRSAAIGQGLNTKSFMELLIGAYATIATGQDPATWIPTDRLMALGNGPDADHRSLAFEVFKSGLLKLFNALVIGDFTHGESTGIPGTIRFHESKFEGFVNEWINLGGGTTLTIAEASALKAIIENGQLSIKLDPLTITSETDNTVTEEGHTHKVTDISIENVVKKTTAANLGFLYNWYAVSDPRNIAPVGFHVPSKAETDILMDLLGGWNNSTHHVREAGLEHWDDPNYGDNSSGLTILGSGNRDYFNGIFGGLKGSAWFWASDYNSEINQAWRMLSTAHDTYAWSRGYDELTYGYSLRFIADSGSPTAAIDYDGNIYPCVTIGDQTWTAVNHAGKRYQNGDWIRGFDGGVHTPISNEDWAANTEEGMMCAYNDDLTLALGTTNTSLSTIIDAKQDALTPDTDYLTPETAAETYAPISVLNDIETILDDILS